MNAQDAAKEELILELTAKNTTRTIKAFSPAGIRLENNLEGEAKGIYNATYYATIDALVKPDGTIEHETRQIHTTDDGETVLVDFTGKSIRESHTRKRFVGENQRAHRDDPMGHHSGLRCSAPRYGQGS